MKINLNLTGKGGISILDACNQILIIVVTVLLGYVAIKFFSPQQIIPEPVAKQAVADQEIFVTDIAAMKVRSFRVYEQSIKARNLFEPLRSDDLKLDPRVMQKALPALHKRIKLIGILIDSDPKAIVEDLKEKQIHFLSKGESIGTVLLEDIQEDKVIFKYDNEKIEMAL